MAVAMRGNVTIRDGETYTAANLGRWNSESDVTLKQDVCRVEIEGLTDSNMGTPALSVNEEA